MTTQYPFLKIDKRFFQIKELSLEEIIILSQIIEFSNNNRPCYMTNDQFAEITRSSSATVDRKLRKMEQLKIIERKTDRSTGKGIRTIEINQLNLSALLNKTSPQNADIKKSSPQNDVMVSSPQNEANLTSFCYEPSHQNDIIKDNIKDKIKDNITAGLLRDSSSKVEAIQDKVCEKAQQVAPSLGTSVSATSCETSVPKPEGKTRRSKIKGEEGINYVYLTPNIIKTATGKILEIMELRSKGTSYNPREKRKS